MNLAGTGDVVMTDIRQTSAGLVLDKSLYGRFYIRDRQEHLIAELYKSEGRQMVLGLEAGAYRIHLEREGELFVAHIELGLEDLLVLKTDHFETAERTPAVARGGDGEWPPRPGFMGPLVGRSRIILFVGMSQTGLGEDVSGTGFVSTSAGTEDLFIGFGYSRWIREDFSVGVTAQIMDGDFSTDVGPDVSTWALGLVSLQVGVRKYLPPSLLRTPVRPFVSLGAGVLIGGEEKTEVSFGGVNTSNSTMGAFGVEPGLGIDFLIGHRFMLGVLGSYRLVTDFPEPLGGRENYSGLEFSVSLSFLFGRGFSE
jgi:hypothetical protein